MAAKLKRWLTGNLYGAVTGSNLQGQLEGFTFRWNRKSSRYRGQLFYRLMECAVD